ncbi:MAG: hypothetical protein ACREHD_18190, partial [Pirellulales bacterium]
MRWKLLVLLEAFAWLTPAAHAAHHDPKVERVISKGLDWLANTQSRLGHWAANEGRYPTAMTALCGMAML